MDYLVLLLAIAVEVAASLALKASAGFTRPLPAFLALSGFGTALWLLARVSERLPLSLTYPTWAGLGIVGATLGAVALFDERVTARHWMGIGTIVLGLVIMYAPVDGARA